MTEAKDSTRFHFHSAAVATPSPFSDYAVPLTTTVDAEAPPVPTTYNAIGTKGIPQLDTIINSFWQISPFGDEHFELSTLILEV